MNNKGFTLVELLATIVLLGIISIISFISINAVLNESKVNDCENLIKSIKSSTKEYVSDNRYSGLFSDVNLNITAEDLINENYLSSQVTDDDGNVMIDNPFTNDNINPFDIKIEVKLYEDFTVESINILNSDNNIIDCSANKW